jgi:hypothetical protein
VWPARPRDNHEKEQRGGEDGGWIPDDEAPVLENGERTRTRGAGRLVVGGSHPGQSGQSKQTGKNCFRETNTAYSILQLLLNRLILDPFITTDIAKPLLHSAAAAAVPLPSTPVLSIRQTCPQYQQANPLPCDAMGTVPSQRHLYNPPVPMQRSDPGRARPRLNNTHGQCRPKT